jgi:hypothetical protein
VLRDVVIVKGFYINIVLEAFFFKKSVWVYRLDLTLCIGIE